MVELKIPLQYAESVLYKAGYVDHPKGVGEFGYIREFAKGRRWHAKTFYRKIEIHLDYTFNNMHKVMYYKAMEKVEFHRVRDTFLTMYPVFAEKKETIIRGPFRNEFAPNLAEIQKEIAKLNNV